MFSCQSLRQNNRRGSTPGKKVVFVRDQIFLQFSQTVEFSEEGGKSGDETENKEPGSFQKKKNEEMIYSNILQIGEDERRRSSGGWVFNYALNRSIMLSLFQLCSYFLNYSPPPLRTFLNGLSIYDSSPHIVTRHIQVYKHIKTHEEKHAQTQKAVISNSKLPNNHIY